LKSGHVYIDEPIYETSPLSPGRLHDPRDHIRGKITITSKKMHEISKEQKTEVRLGAMFILNVGSYPPRPWYVHSVSQSSIVLAPWLPVVLGTRVDYIGKDAENREIMAVIGDLVVDQGFLLQAEKYKFISGMIVGDMSKDVYGELYQTGIGSWAVLGGRPNGEPAIDHLVREFASISRRDSGGRFDYMCYNKPGIPTKKLCHEANGVWDRPCTRDHECPFFSQDARGGCLDGYCEMPIGVENMAFTLGSGTPICSNCGAINGDPFDCCSKIKYPKYVWNEI
jgi:hypothetical protein